MARDASRVTEAGMQRPERLYADASAMRESLRLMSEMCVKYNAQYLAAGFTQAEMDEIATLRAELDGLCFEQESFARSLPMRSRERVEKLNTVFRYMQETRQLARLVYAQDEASRRMFRMPRPRRKRKEIMVVNGD